MPYATPSHQSPVAPSYGRPGHRRSYSHITLPAGAPFAFTSTSTSGSMASLPRRRSASASAAAGLVHGVTTNGSASGNTTNGADAADKPPTPRKTTFQLGRDDDEDDSSLEDERGAASHSNASAHAKPRSPRDGSDDDDEEEDDMLRRLPPLRLRPKALSSFEQLGVPFPRSSPRSSPLHSPVGSRETVARPVGSVYPHPQSQPRLHVHVHQRNASEQPPASQFQPKHQSTAPMPHHTFPRPPPVSRTFSSPILLSNGKPLRSSLKSSSSSPHIPFPSQSLVPSIMWPELHRRGTGSSSGSPSVSESYLTPTPAGAPALHQRAASAPSTPHLGMAVPPPTQFSPASSSFSNDATLTSTPTLTSIEGGGDAQSPSEPDLASSVSSLPSLTSNSSPSSSAPPSPTSSTTTSTSYFQSTHPHPQHAHSGHHQHPHAPKNVHFPSQETDIATIKVFSRSARPASLSLTSRESGGESQTETETEGEGAGGGFGLRWGGWGSVGGAGGYPFPKVGAGAGANARRSHSPLSSGAVADDNDYDDGSHSANTKEKEKEFYDVDEERCSFVPMQDGVEGGVEGGKGNGHRVGEGHVYVESVGFVRSAGAFADAPSSHTLASASALKAHPPSRPLTLTGTILVRNIAYRKTVAVRFTLDEWHTTNDVLATYECSLAALPAGFARTPGAGGRERVGVPWGLNVNAGANVNAGVGGNRGQGGAGRTDRSEGWDRFRFSINLEDYASSGTLESRTMWFVGRYTAGVDVRVGASEASSLASTTTTTNGVRAGAGTVAGGDGALGMAPAEGAQEWWDNNAGRNYRIAFRKVKVAAATPAPAPRARVHAAAAAGSGSGVYRRGVAVSAPSAYPGTSSSSPPPTQGSKAYPAPPQISSSISFPGTGTGPDGYPYPHTPPSTTIPTPQQIQQQKAHQAAVTQSTLARLKKLNLRNYAAPRTGGYGSGGAAASPVEVPAPPTMPVQTPRANEDQGVRVVSPGEDDERHHQHLQHHDADADSDRTPTIRDVVAPSWGADVSMAMAMAKGAGAQSPSPSELGTSPPFSAMADMGMGMGIGMRVPASRVLGVVEGDGDGEGGGYWPWSSFGNVSGARDAAGTGTGGDATRVAPEEMLSAPVEQLLEDIKERSTAATASTTGVDDGSGAALGSASPASSSSRPMLLPHRKRKESLSSSSAGHVHAHIEHGEHEHRKPTFSIGVRGSSSSSSGSDSGAQSKTLGPIVLPGPSRRAMSPIHVNNNSSNTNPFNTPNTSNTTSTFTSNTSTNGASAPKANGNGSGPAMWGVRTSSPSPLSSGSSSPVGGGPASGSGSGLGPGPLPRTRFGVGVGGTRSPMRVSPLGSPSLSANSSASTMLGAGGTGAGAGTPTDDAVYQAFVRQWCFAQAPGPTVGSK